MLSRPAFNDDHEVNLAAIAMFISRDVARSRVSSAIREARKVIMQWNITSVTIDLGNQAGCGRMAVGAWISGTDLACTRVIQCHGHGCR